MPDSECKIPPTSAQIAEDRLEPIRAFIHARHGRLATLVAKMKSQTSTPITRQAVSRWLHKESGKRQEMRLGTFTVMENAYQAMVREDAGLAPSAESAGS
jgi:hypothetical protein